MGIVLPKVSFVQIVPKTENAFKNYFNIQLKTLRAVLGNVFTKSIYHNLTVIASSDSCINAILKMRVSQ